MTDLCCISYKNQQTSEVLNCTDCEEHVAVVYKTRVFNNPNISQSRSPEAFKCPLSFNCLLLPTLTWF